MQCPLIEQSQKLPEKKAFYYFDGFGQPKVDTWFPIMTQKAKWYQCVTYCLEGSIEEKEKYHVSGSRLCCWIYSYPIFQWFVRLIPELSKPPRSLRLLSVLRQRFCCCWLLVYFVTPTVGVCNCSMFCCMLLYVYSSFAIILIKLMGKRELITLLSLSSWCLVMVVWLFFAVQWICLWFVTVVFLIILTIFNIFYGWGFSTLICQYLRYWWKDVNFVLLNV